MNNPFNVSGTEHTHRVRVATPAAPSDEGPATAKFALGSLAVTTFVPDRDLPKSPSDSIQLIAMIEPGGTSTVYHGKHVYLGTSYAVKIFRQDPDPDRRRYNQQSVLAEIKLAGALKGANLVGVIDGSHDAGSEYLVLEYLPHGNGKHLIGRIQRGYGPESYFSSMQSADTLSPLRDIANALTDCHRRGFIHRDVKPANILIGQNSDGTCRGVLADFGLAAPRFATDQYPEEVTGPIELIPRSVAESMRACLELELKGKYRSGTPQYIAPEQILDPGGKGLHPAVDVREFGAVLYELMTGDPPHSAINGFPQLPHEIMNQLAGTKGAVKLLSPLEFLEKYSEELVPAKEAVYPFEDGTGKYRPYAALQRASSVVMEALSVDPDLRPKTPIELFERFASAISGREDAVRPWGSFFLRNWRTGVLFAGIGTLVGIPGWLLRDRIKEGVQNLNGRKENPPAGAPKDTDNPASKPPAKTP